MSARARARRTALAEPVASRPVVGSRENFDSDLRAARATPACTRLGEKSALDLVKSLLLKDYARGSISLCVGEVVAREKIAGKRAPKREKN